MSDTISINKCTLPISRPQSVEDLKDLIRDAAAQQISLFPFGGQTFLQQGLPPSSTNGKAVDLRGLNQLIDYPARDMTITVQAGITISELQKHLSQEGQQLPVDIPLPEQATLGGAIATNASGPRRFGHGTLRDYVIGISIANDLGQEIKAGGRVVKNVAGYDLMKLYTGSFGSLGIITQATLKVKPIGESFQMISAPCSSEDYQPVLGNILPKTATRPVLISLVNAPTAQWLNGSTTSMSQLIVGFEEKRVTVDWQMRTLETELPDALEKYAQKLQEDASRDKLAKLRDFPVTVTAMLGWKANILPAHTAEFFQLADRLQPQPMLLSYAGNGIIYGLWSDISLASAQQAISALTSAAQRFGGSMILHRCPDDWKSTLPVWGPTRPDWELMKAVKAKLDPRNLFNPGRFVGGI